MTDPAGRLLSRRSVLRGGIALGLHTVTVAALAPAAASAAIRSTLAPRSPAATSASGHLILDYAQSEPHGWGPGSTVGGHVGSRDFTHLGKSYRVSLLPFGQPGDAPDPVYEAEPTDPNIGFKRVLAEEFGTHYSFRYMGGFRGSGEFHVRSYSVYVSEPGTDSPDLACGADLHVVYDPDIRKGDPGVDDDLQWIHVVRSFGPPLDNLWRPNPFFFFGGLTSIHGYEVCSFYQHPGFGGIGGPASDVEFMAEAFLVRDTGMKDSSGKAVIEIFGGIKFGWRAQEIGG